MPKLMKPAFLLAVLLALGACTNFPTPAVTENLNQLTPVVTELTPISLPSATSLPASDTPPQLTPTTTPLPPVATATLASPSLNPAGPYVLFFSQSGIWISNPDGSSLTRLAEYNIPATLDAHKLIAPTGDRLALVAENEGGLDLVIIQLPGGEQEIVTRLIDSQPAGSYDPASPNAFATYAMRDFDSLAWQPAEGRLLAFIGAMNGDTADLYLYETESKEIIQLTDGPSQAILPVWSPDGQYILHYGVRWVPPFGGAIVGPNQMDGVWAVRASDGEVITLPKPEGVVPHFVGWQDDSHFITFDPGDCYAKDLRSVDILTGAATPLMDNTFYYEVALSPENGALLFSSKAECASSLGEGVYMLLPGAAPTRLIDRRAWEISWMPESRVFDAYPEGLVKSDGQTIYTPPVYNSSFEPAVSLLEYQAWNAIQDQVGHVMVRANTRAWNTIFTGDVDELIWDPVDGTILFITTESGPLYAATYPNFSPQLVGDLGAGTNQVIWVP